MTADFVAIRRRAERLAALWRATREVRVTSPAGTDLRATVDGARADGLADRHLPEPWRGLGAARRRGLAAADRGHVRRASSSGNASPRTSARSTAPVTITVRDGRAVAIEGGPRPTRLRRDRRERPSTPTTSARSASGSTRPRASATRSPRRRRRSGPSTSRSAIRPTSTAGWSNATSTSTAWSWSRRSSSTASPVVVAGRHVYDVRAVTAEPRDRAADRDALPGAASARRSSSGCAPSRGPGRGRGGRRSARRGRGASASIAGRPGRQRVRRPGGELRGGDARPLPSGRRRGRSATRRGAMSHVSSASRQRAAGRVRGGARRRSRRPGLDRVLLGLSGADANDTAIKLARTADRPARGHRVLGRLLRPRSSGVIGLNGKSAFRGSGRARRGRPLPALSRTRIAGRSGRPRPAPATGRSRSCAMRSRIRRPGSGRSRPSSSSRSRATAASSSRRTGSSRACATLCDRHGDRPHLRRDPERVRADRPTLGGRALGRRAGPDDRRQGHRRRDGGLGGRRARSGSWRTGRPAPTRRRSWATPSTSPPAARRSTSCGASGSGERSAAAGRDRTRAACTRASPTRPRSARSAASACSSASRS